MYSMYNKSYKGQGSDIKYQQDIYKEILGKEKQRFNELLKSYAGGENKFDLGGFR